ncbi:hypothetical protein ABZ924_15855 [Streptomyces sp. NPDC046876]|uniref:SCO7613 C-terminal domain-containing membrane protein n=1 Tax=Streptomyces sp. NPDC046876 TaxID=3155616 RepID=UPI0033F13A23
MDMPLPPAQELALIDRELAQLDARRGYLLARRQWLLQVPAAGTGWIVPAPGAGRAREASAPGAQNVLLTLGAVLLAVAALAFTLVSWGSLGIAGRSAVLAVVTAAALGAPALLLRRGLRSTAESVAALGLLLTVLDAYALHAVAAAQTDGLGYAAGSAAVLAAAWAGYGRLLRGLAVPAVGAVAAVQLPLLLAALAAQAEPVGLGWALLATAALDGVLAGFGAGLGARAARCAPVVWALGAVWGVGALLTAVAELAAAGSAGAAAGAALLAAACAGLGVAVAWRVPGAWPAAAAGGLAAVAALGGPVRPELPGAWPVVAWVLLALPLLGAASAGALPGGVRRGLGLAGAGVAGAAAAWGLAVAGAAALSRAAVLGEVWAATSPAEAYGPGAAAVVCLLIAAGAARWAVRLLPGRRGPGADSPASAVGGADGAVGGADGAADGAAGAAETAGAAGGGPAVGAVGALAVVCGWAGLFTAPLGHGLPVAVVLAAQLAVTAGAAVGALRWAGRPGSAAAVCAALGAVDVSVAALDGRLATFAVFGLLGGACAAVAAQRGAASAVRAGAAVLVVGYAAATAAALAAVAGLAVAWWSLPLLAVAAAAAVPGPRLGAVRVAAEAAGAAVAGLALLVAAAAGEPPLLALVCALAGVVCAGAALRADRRALGWAAAVLGVAAAWIRLWASGVAVVEAYTLPVTVAALAVGLLRRRTNHAASSWVAYGPGLAATLLPSLVAAWEDPHWLRPLLLGLASLGVTLAGAGRRLQAPLLLGGGCLAAVALHELAPYVVQVAGMLPRWVPPALAGLLLLAVGATYERRLRDVRRLRKALGRLG